MNLTWWRRSNCRERAEPDLLVDPRALVQAIASGAAIGGVYALVALGICLMWRTTRVFNFAHGDIAIFAAYMAWQFATFTDLPIGVIIVCVCGLTGLGSAMLERVCFRPLYGGSIVPPMLVSVGLYIALESLIRLIWGSIPKSAPTIFGNKSFSIVGIYLVPEVLAVALISIAIALACIIFIARTRLGTALRSCSEDPEVSQLLGINVRGLYRLSFVMAGVLAAISGVLSAPIVGLRPDTGLTLGLSGIIAAAIGGLGSFQGALVGALLLGVLQSGAVLFVDPSFAPVLTYGLLVVVVLVRPAGLFGVPRFAWGAQ